MSEYNIQMNKYNALNTEYDQLYPVTKIKNVDGLDTALQSKPNPNLLDNWYFSNPVDQRQGRIVKPNTTYYSDNQLTTAAGTTGAYVTAYRYATGTANGVNYASFKLEDKDTAPTYYAAPENVVRGYTGAGYGIDRWGQPSGHTICLTKEGLVGNEVTDLYQGIEFVPWGKEVTFSVLTANGMVKTTFVLPESVPNEFTVVAGNTEQDVGSLGAYAQSGVYGGFWVSMFIDAGNAIKAAKLELGSQQTIAHQDENGNWVLNEIPDYGEQLARCQRYDYIIGRADDAAPVGLGYAYSDTSALTVIELPEMMRANPTVSITGTINLRFSGPKNVSVNSVNNYGFSGDKVQLYCPGLSGLTQGQSCDIYVSQGSKMEFNSNL